MWVSRWLNSIASTSRHVRISQAGHPTDVQRVLVGHTLTASVREPTSWSDWSDCEVFMVDVKRILTEGRFHGATQFYIAGDLNIQMEFDDVTEQGASLYETHVWTGVCKNLHHCQ